MKRQKAFLLTGARLLIGGALIATPALAANPTSNSPSAPASQTMQKPAATNGTAANTGTTNNGSQASEHAKTLLNQAVAEVKKMEQDPQLKKLMAKAKGIYLVPEFGRGALIVGGRGGAGVVLAHKNGKWTDPAFYNFGAISLGAQAGGSGGQIAFLLMNDNAIDAFKSGNKIALNAEAGLSIVTYSASGQASWGKGDIVMWSDTAGAYAGATVSVTDLNWDNDTNQAYYGRKVEPSKIFAGEVNTPNAEEIKAALPS